MSRLRQHIFFFALLVVLVFPPRAHAYLDPGTGSYVLQVVAAVFFASLFLIKTWWTHIKNFVLGLFGRKGKTSEKPNSKDKE